MPNMARSVAVTGANGVATSRPGITAVTWPSPVRSPVGRRVPSTEAKASLTTVPDGGKWHHGLGGGGPGHSVAVVYYPAGWAENTVGSARRVAQASTYAAELSR
ncbi:hypothetical protein GCM10027186_00440 [Micromonospora schwarzwaldensis]